MSINNPFEGQQTRDQSVGTLMGAALICIGTAIGLSYAFSTLFELMQKPKRLPLRGYVEDDEEAPSSADYGEYEGDEDYGYDEWPQRERHHIDFELADRMLEAEELADTERAPSRRALKAAGTAAVWGKGQAKRGYEGVRRLPWGEYGEGAKRGAYAAGRGARTAAKRAGEGIKRVPWSEYGRKVRYGAQAAGTGAKRAAKRAGEGLDWATDEMGGYARKVRETKRGPEMLPPYQAYQQRSTVPGGPPSSLGRDTIPAGPPSSMMAQSRPTWISPGQTVIPNKRSRSKSKRSSSRGRRSTKSRSRGSNRGRLVITGWKEGHGPTSYRTDWAGYLNAPDPKETSATKRALAAAKNDIDAGDSWKTAAKRRIGPLLRKYPGVGDSEPALEIVRVLKREEAKAKGKRTFSWTHADYAALARVQDEARGSGRSKRSRSKSKSKSKSTKSANPWAGTPTKKVRLKGHQEVTFSSSGRAISKPIKWGEIYVDAPSSFYPKAPRGKIWVERDGKPTLMSRADLGPPIQPKSKGRNAKRSKSESRTKWSAKGRSRDGKGRFTKAKQSEAKSKKKWSGKGRSRDDKGRFAKSKRSKSKRSKTY